MAFKASVFSGPMEVATLFNSFVGLPPDPTPGVPIGYDVETGRLVCFNPWELKQRGIIHSTVCMFLGDKHHGKSASMKIIADRLMLLAAGLERMRVSINDHKPEGADSEYALFSQYHNSKVFRIGEMSVNPFETALYQSPGTHQGSHSAYELGILSTAEAMCEFAKGDRLSSDEHTALRIQVATMLSYREQMWSPQLLAKLLMSIAESDVTHYFSHLDQALEAQLIERAKRLHEDTNVTFAADQIRALTRDRANNYRLITLQSAGLQVSAYLSRILHGSYGNMFGDTHSLHQMLTQRVSTKDWRGVEEEPARLMRILLTKIKISAVECNNVQLLPHIELDDERHRLMRYFDYARAESHFSEIARSIHTFSMSASHRLESIRMGDLGSEHRRLSNTIINNLGMVFIGRQSNNPQALEEIRALYELTSEDVKSLPRLEPHVFLMKAGDAPRRYVKFFATPEQITFLPTNSAGERMVQHLDRSNPEQVRRFAELNGLTYVGASN